MSARIFDLALNGAGLSTTEAMALCFAAQAGYRRAGLDPNATAVYRRVADAISEISDPVTDIDIIALQAGVTFLGLDFGRLNTLLGSRRRQVNDLARTVGLQSMAGTMYGPAQAVVTGASSLLTYLRSGDTEQLDVARTALRSVVDLTAGQGDHYAKWVAAHLLVVADGMGHSSVWAVLPPDTPPPAAHAFTYGSNPVLTLWPPQQELLRRGNRNPLDPGTKRLLLSVPTSAGKTLLAQVIICAHLASDGGDVCFVTPLRSLGREVRQSLGKRVRMLRRNLGFDLPDHVEPRGDLLDDLVGSDGERAGNVEVMTPERLMQSFRADPSGVLERFTLFVVDEAQLLAQRGRGFVLEGLLAILAEGDARVVLLSGVLGNAVSLASWLDPTDDRAGAGSAPGNDHPSLYTSSWRGPRQLHVLMYSDKIEAQAVRQPLPDGATRVTTPLRGLLWLRSADGKTVALHTSDTEPVGQLVQKITPNGTWTRDKVRTTPTYKVIARTAVHLLPAGSLLMVVSQRSHTKGAAQEMAAQLPESHKTRDLVTFLRDRLGAAHPLVDCAQHGVGFHHAGLPTDVLEALEDAVRAEQLDAIVATTTLTEGVNLPVRTVVVAETRYAGQDPDTRLSPAHLLNAMGRAGRAGKETEGWIALALAKAPELRDFRELAPTADDLAVRSSLLRDTALDALEAAETLVAETVDNVLSLPAGAASDFASYVWLILSTWEQLGRLTNEGDLPGAINRLLALSQMPDDLRARWLSLAATISSVFGATDQVKRHRWASSGLSLPSAHKLDELVETTALAMLREHGTTTDFLQIPDILTVDATIALLDAVGVFEELLALDEAKVNGKGPWRFTRGHNEVGVPHVDGLRLWLRGARLEQIANSIVPDTINEVARLEQTVDAVNRTFEHYLSWTIGVLVELVNQRLTSAQTAATLPNELGPMIHYGVDTPVAVALLASGIRSRALAHRLGTHASRNALTLEGLRAQLTQASLDTWRRDFAVTAAEILDLLEFVRAPRHSLLRDLLETGAATATVTLAPGVNADDTPQPVAIRHDTDAASPIEVVTAHASLGVVNTGSHTDVREIVDTGVDVTFILGGDQLTISRNIE